jgi:hypothetical protein
MARKQIYQFDEKVSLEGNEQVLIQATTGKVYKTTVDKINQKAPLKTFYGQEIKGAGDLTVPGLKPVATSGDYNDLNNKPALKPVATSGDYVDLTGKPIIPSKTSDLTNDSGFIDGLKVGVTPITGGATGAIFYEKVDHTFGEIMGFQYDDSNKTLSYFDDLVSPEVGMLVGKSEIMPGVFIPYSGFTSGNNPMTDMGIAYVDGTYIGAQKTIFLGNQFGTRLTIENQNVTIGADRNINLFTGQNTALSASQNVNINADQYINLKAYQIVNINADRNINLKAGQIVNIDADQYVSINSDGDIYLDAKQNFKLDLTKTRLLFSEYGFELINTMGGGDSRFQYIITDGVTPDQFGIFGASPVDQQPLSIDPSTLPTSNDTETTVKEIAQALINYGLLTL